MSEDNLNRRGGTLAIAIRRGSCETLSSEFRALSLRDNSDYMRKALGVFLVTDLGNGVASA